MAPARKTSDEEYAYLRSQLPRYYNLKANHDRSQFWTDVQGEFFVKFPIHAYCVERKLLPAADEVQLTQEETKGVLDDAVRVRKAVSLIFFL